MTTHIAPARGFGGVAESASRVHEGLVQAGLQVTSIASDATSDGRLTPAEAEAQIGAPKVLLYRTRIGKSWGIGLGAVGPIWRETKDPGVLVYVNGISTFPTTIALLVAVLRRRATMVAVRGGLMPDYVRHLRARKRVKYLLYLALRPWLRRVDAIHATAQGEAQGVSDFLGSRPGVRVVQIPNSVRRPPTAPRLEHRAGRRGKQIGYAGRIAPEKGVLEALKIWQNVATSDDRFRIAGVFDGSDYSLEVERLVAADPRVDFVGYLPEDELAEFYAQLDWLILPSGLGEGAEHENFGNVVPEAMSVGTPVLVSRGLAWDHVEATGCGLVFERTAEGLGRVLTAVGKVTQARADEFRSAAVQESDRYSVERTSVMFLHSLQQLDQYRNRRVE